MTWRPRDPQALLPRGLQAAVISGLVLFAVDAVHKAGQPVFLVKLTLIAVAIVVTSRIRRRMSSSISVMSFRLTSGASSA